MDEGAPSRRERTRPRSLRLRFPLEARSANLVQRLPGRPLAGGCDLILTGTREEEARCNCGHCKQADTQGANRCLLSDAVVG